MLIYCNNCAWIVRETDELRRELYWVMAVTPDPLIRASRIGYPFMRPPSLLTVPAVRETCEHTHTEIDGQWVPARPLGFYSLWHRIRCAWLVFTGKADALKWPQ